MFQRQQAKTPPVTLMGGGKSGVYKVEPSVVNPEEVDYLLAHEMRQLSVQERERAYEQLHGICASYEDEERQVQEALLKMQVELGKIHHKPAYEEALRIGSTFVLDPKFRKRFLWAENLDPHKAAVRMTKYLQYASEAYGPKALLRRLRYSDLGPGAVAYLKSGSGLILPARDSSGRRVLCVAKDCIGTMDRLRNDFFLTQEISDNEEEQKRGLVLVLCLFNMVQNANDPAEKDMIEKIMSSVPGKFTAVHLLLPDRPLYHCIKATYALIVGKQCRSHMRIHAGSTTEILYSLKTFGIPVEYLPHNLKRDCKQALKRHLKWVALLEAKEEAMLRGHDFDKNPIIDCPTRKDVLLGKGRQIMKHPGNLELRHLLEEKIGLWESASNQEKAVVARELVREIVASGGRFIREEEAGWFVEVNEDVARQKVSIGFRDTVKRKKRRADEAASGHHLAQEHAGLSMQGQSPSPVASANTSAPAGMQVLDSQTFRFSGMSNDSFPKRRRLSDDSNCDCLKPRAV